ncbi:MAG: hypothetical protein R2877_07300 [Bdellovibrionota bacterium]
MDELSPDFTRELDYVITLCAEEVCPSIISKAKKFHWPFPDPATQKKFQKEMLQRFRSARDFIQQKILQFQQEPVLLLWGLLAFLATKTFRTGSLNPSKSRGYVRVIRTLTL